MGFFSKIFGVKNLQSFEDKYITLVTDELVRVKHSSRKTQEIIWKDIKEILLHNTDEGPFLPDVWLVLVGDSVSCSIPQGCKGYEQVYNIVSKYEGFNFENVIASMSSTNNEQFLLWKRKY
jgi:hypothetical protein